MIYYDREEAIDQHMTASGDWEPELIDVKHHYLIGNIVFVYSDLYAEFERIYCGDELSKHIIKAFQPMPEKEFVFHNELFEMIFSEYFRQKTAS